MNSVFTFRVMTYNILYSCHERAGDEYVFQSRRADAVQAVVAAEAPDVLALTEAVYCDARGRKLRLDLVAMFGLPHLYSDGTAGDWTNCVLSRFPITAMSRLPLGVSPNGVEQSALRVTLTTDAGPVRLDVVHPSPHISEAERVEAFKPLFLPTVEPRIVAGDFNALSDEDAYTMATLVEQLTPYTKDPAAIAATMLDRQLLRAGRAHGLRDALPLEARTHTLPTRLSRPHATQGAKLRIDYVLVTGALQARAGRVVQSEAADRASDHYPVVVDLELPLS
jgi:endonuclease/exonuclease/phosphatase family metal-dependent hydrolase